MEAAFASVLGLIVGTVVIAGALLILGFLSLGMLAPIGAVVHSISSHRHARAVPARRNPARIGRPVTHH